MVQVHFLYKADIKAGDLKSYADNFYKLFMTEKSPETIFEVAFIPGIRSHTGASLCLPAVEIWWTQALIWLMHLKWLMVVPV